MRLIDFDARFTQYLHTWMEAHANEYQSLNEMEQEVPNVFLAFINTPAEWLDDISPGAYFTQFDDGKDLVDWLVLYSKNNMSIPSLLIDRIIEVGLPCEKRLLLVIKDSQVPREARMVAIAILREMESTAPKAFYCHYLETLEQADDISENIIESLHQMGPAAVKPLTDILFRATPAGQDAILDVLVNYPCSEKTLKLLITKFVSNPDKRALYAAYLGKLGDERALDPLIEAASDAALPYHDYIEIRCAVERLGGEAPIRFF